MKHSRKPLLLEKWDFIILLGESGGGKGTLIQNILRYWLPDLHTASMGDIFRRKAQEDPAIKEMTEKGILVDDSLTNEIFREFAMAHTPGIIDGYPRNRQQTIDLIRFIKDNNWRVLLVDIKCSMEKIIERLLARKRPDDNLTIMHKRHQDHLILHPVVMEEVKTRPDLFDIITLDGNLNAEIVFSNFLLDVLRLVDMLYFYDMTNIDTAFSVNDNETTVNPAINRWICGFLRSIQKKLMESDVK
ncbi:MAG: nucleoside monophosphate kinase [Defluviitaleaceae bacterium]|nr:nucleoside monophosphate kinase [Defluviitaleaceae bacterium]MCL2275641.1 nucleoside monophosphate kinase [Defluviitaleaceae bacterium]